MFISKIENLKKLGNGKYVFTRNTDVEFSNVSSERRDKGWKKQDYYNEFGIVLGRAYSLEEIVKLTRVPDVEFLTLRP